VGNLIYNLRELGYKDSLGDSGLHDVLWLPKMPNSQRHSYRFIPYRALPRAGSNLNPCPGDKLLSLQCRTVYYTLSQCTENELL